MDSLTSQIQSAAQAQGIDLSGVNTQALAGASMAVLAIALVICLINCFFGLKMIKVWAALLGFVIGFMLGAGVCGYFGVDGMVAGAIGIVVGIAVGALGFWLYLAAVFILAWLFGISIAGGILGMDTMVKVIVVIVIALVFAVIALRFVEPVMIILTGLQGGLAAGSIVVQMASLPGAYTSYIIGGILAVLGIVVQFILESKRKAKLHIAKADKVRAQNSTENEVNKMRSVLDYTDKVKADPDADDYYEDEDED